MERRKSDFQKDIIKEALKEWMSEQFQDARQAFGGWTFKWMLRALSVIVFTALIYAWLRFNGSEMKHLIEFHLF